MRFLISMVCLLTAMTISAQTTISVKDTKNNALVGATIAYKKFGTTTNNEGIAKLPKLEKGTLITVSYVGFKTQSQTYNGNAMVFVLEESGFLLDDVVVVSQLPRATAKTPISFKNIDKKQISKRNLGQDLPMLLEGTPSLVTTSYAGAGVGYTGFRIRGTSTERINVTVNGVPLNDSESHGVYWVDIPDIASATNNIQIQRGVGTSSNGAAAFGATLNLETDAHEKEPYAKIGFSGGSFHTFRQNYQAGTGLLGNRLSFDAKYSDIYSSGYVDRAFSDLKSYFAMGTYHGDDFSIKLLAFGGDEKTYQAWNGVSPEVMKKNRKYNPAGEYNDENGKQKFYDNETDNYKQNHYQLFYTHKLNSSWNINATLHYTKGKGYYENYKSGKKLKNYGITPTANGVKETDLIQQKWLDNDFYGVVFSTQYKKNAWDIALGGSANHYEGGHYGEVIWSKAGIFPHNYRWYNNDGEKDEMSTYAKINYAVNNKFNLFGDLQYRKIDYKIKGIHDDLRDISQTQEYGFFNPKFGITYIPNKNIRTYLSWGRAHREPSRSNLKDLSAEEKKPTAEKLDDFELGLAYKTAKWQLSANLYYMLYKDQLVHTGMINNVGEAIMTNIADSYRMGVEIEAGVTFNEHIRWSGNATFSRNKAEKFTAYIDNWTTWKQEKEEIATTNLAFSPEIVANSIFVISPISNFEVALQSTYVGKQYLDNTSSENRKLDAYFINNINVNYKWQPKKLFKEIAFSLQLKNIGNTKYETDGWVYRYINEGKKSEMIGLYPQAGCHLMLGVNFIF